MKKLLLIGLIVIATLAICSCQISGRERQVRENELVAASLAEMHTRIAAAESAGQTAERRSADLRAQLDLRHAASTSQRPIASIGATRTEIAAPDPSRQGGWPAGAPYFYLPKQVLTNAGYKLLAGRELTDEAAALLGMSPTERAQANRLFAGLFDQFRGLETKAMTRIDPPETWQGFNMGFVKADRIVTYQIPGLGENLGPVKQAFNQQLEQTLGPARAQLVSQATENQLRQELDDLGGGQRTIGFIQGTEKDGSYSLWYGIADARHGEGSFQRVEDNLDPNSQIAYYANLFGVKLPGK